MTNKEAVSIPWNQSPQRILWALRDAVLERYPGEFWRLRDSLHRLDHEAGAMRRITGSQFAALVPDAAHLAEINDEEQAVRWKRVPSVVCRNLYDHPSFGAPLESLVRAPWVNAAGEPHLVHGYDEEAGVFLWMPECCPDPYAITPEDTAYVLPRILDAEFRSPVDRAAGLAAYLHCLRGPALYGSPSPMYLVAADRPEVGKTYLARMLSIVATGREPSTTTMPTNAAEMRYTIGNLLGELPTQILFDNIGTGSRVGNADLHALLTASADMAQRKVGSSDSVRGDPTKAQWIATMNQPRLDAEQSRRTLPIRLEPRGGRPFIEPDLIRWTHEHRELILAVLLRLLMDWHQQGEPRARKLPSFERWSHLVGSPAALTTDGAEDWLSGETRIRPADEVDLEELAAAWPAGADGRPARLSAGRALAIVDALGLVELEEVAGHGSPKSRATKFGIYLKRVCAMRTGPWRETRTRKGIRYHPSAQPAQPCPTSAQPLKSSKGAEKQGLPNLPNLDPVLGESPPGGDSGSPDPGVLSYNKKPTGTPLEVGQVGHPGESPAGTETKVRPTLRPTLGLEVGQVGQLSHGPEVADVLARIQARGIRVDPEPWRALVTLARRDLERTADTDPASRDRLRAMSGYDSAVYGQAALGHRVRCSYREQGTGRIGAVRPALQTITRGLRSAIVPEKGRRLICADWRACHVQIVAMRSGRPDLMEGEVYSQICEWMGALEDRKLGKALTLALINRAGPDKLSEMALKEPNLAGIRAKARWTERYPEAEVLLERWAGEHEWSSPMGRRICMPEEKRYPQAAVAWHLQAIEADALALALVALEQAGLEVILPMHDGVLIEEDWKTPLEQVRRIMTRALGVQLGARLEPARCVTVTSGEDWALCAS